MDVINYLKKKYQGVKVLQLVARMVCYCKMMVFSPFKLRTHIIIHPRITNGNQ